jgi:hypothetical protein
MDKVVEVAEDKTINQEKLSSANMFLNCTALVGGNNTAYDANKTNKEYARIDNPPDAPGYLTYKSAT